MLLMYSSMSRIRAVSFSLSCARSLLYPTHTCTHVTRAFLLPQYATLTEFPSPTLDHTAVFESAVNSENVNAIKPNHVLAIVEVYPPVDM